MAEIVFGLEHDFVTLQECLNSLLPFSKRVNKVHDFSFKSEKSCLFGHKETIQKVSKRCKYASICINITLYLSKTLKKTGGGIVSAYV
jgi:uncharacterized membrane protein